MLGVLALTVLVESSGFSRNLRNQFRTGATFGTWLWFLDRLESEGITPRIQQLTTLSDRSNTRALLARSRFGEGSADARPSLLRNRRMEGRVAVETSGGVGGLALVGDNGDEGSAGL